MHKMTHIFEVMIERGDYLEELAECDVREEVVRLVPAAFRVRLLPKLDELALQLSDRTQVQDVIARRILVQARVARMGGKPERKKRYFI